MREVTDREVIPMMPVHCVWMCSSLAHETVVYVSSVTGSLGRGTYGVAILTQTIPPTQPRLQFMSPSKKGVRLG